MAPRKKSPTPANVSTVRSALPLDPVTEVRGNLRHGRIDVKLGRLTLILGENGAGKTTIVNALTLALCGMALDVAGQDACADDAALFRHLSHDGEPLEAEIRTAKGQRFWYRKEDSRASEGAHMPRDMHAHVLPLTGLRAALTGSNQTVRKWVLDASGRWITAETVRNVIAACGASTLLPAPNDTEASLVAWLISQETTATESRGAAQRLQSSSTNTVAQLSPQAGMPVSADEIERAAAALVQSGAAESLLPGEREKLTAEMDRMRGTAAMQQQEYAQTSAALAATQQRLAEIDAWIATQPVALRPNDRDANVLRALETFVDAHRDGYAGSCVLCATAVPADVQVPRLDALLAQVRATLNPVDPTTEMRAERTSLTATVQMHERTLRNIEEANASLQSRANALTARLTLPDADAASANVDALKAAHAELVRRRTLHDEIAKARANADAANAEVERYGAIATAAKRVRETLLTSATGMLCKEVTRWLPEGWQFEIKIEDTSIRLGMVLPDGLGFRSALSGAQEAALYVAIACAMSVGDVCVAIPAERQWSAETLRDVMRALEAAPAQVVLVSTVMPAGRINKSWTVLNVVSKKALVMPVGAADDGVDDTDDTDGEIEITSNAVETTEPNPADDDLVVQPIESLPGLGLNLQTATRVVPSEGELAARARAMVTPDAPDWMPRTEMPFATVDDVQAFFAAQHGRKMPVAVDAYTTPQGATYTLFADGSVTRTSIGADLKPSHKLWYGLHAHTMKLTDEN